MGKEWNPETIFDVLGSEHARSILTASSQQPMDAEALADACDTSLPTVYRRVNALQEYDLLKEETNIDADGNHYKTYETNLQEISFEVTDDGFEIDIALRRDLTDRFDEFWGGLRAEQPAGGEPDA